MVFDSEAGSRAKKINLTAAVDGSLCEVIPIEDEIYKRLQLLQGQLSRNVQQVAGLNAKAFRYGARWHKGRYLLLTVSITCFLFL